MSDSFSVGSIDHVELVVSDRDVAIDWYRTVLGLERRHEFDEWIETGGPVLCSSDGGGTNLALFEGERRAADDLSGFQRVAFRVNGDEFLAFVERSENLLLYDSDASTLDQPEIVDHELAFSTYFCDPDGNRLEITTYDYDAVADQIDSTGDAASH